MLVVVTVLVCCGVFGSVYWLCRRQAKLVLLPGYCQSRACALRALCIWLAVGLGIACTMILLITLLWSAGVIT